MQHHPKAEDKAIAEHLATIRQRVHDRAEASAAGAIDPAVSRCIAAIQQNLAPHCSHALDQRVTEVMLAAAASLRAEATASATDHSLRRIVQSFTLPATS